MITWPRTLILTSFNPFEPNKLIMSESSSLPACPKCQCEYTYAVMEMYNCPECGFEWSKNETLSPQDSDDAIQDANGVILKDGDTVTIIKDLKVKGSSAIIKVGTKIKNIRLGGGDHGVDCKIPGIGSMKIKPEFVRKV